MLELKTTEGEQQLEGGGGGKWGNGEKGGERLQIFRKIKINAFII